MMGVELFWEFPSRFCFPLFLPKDVVYLSSHSVCVLSLLMKEEPVMILSGYTYIYIYIKIHIYICLFSLCVHAFLQLLPHARRYVEMYIHTDSCVQSDIYLTSKATSRRYSAAALTHWSHFQRQNGTDSSQAWADCSGLMPQELEMTEPLSPQPPALPLLSCCHPCTSTGVATNWLQPHPSSNRAQDAATALF